jgi:tetratricopeptide (TPR) repeat protein
MVESGQTLSARYSLVRRLGAGGHGEVWLAADRERQGYAALKILQPAIAQDAEVLNAYANACERTRGLDHPHILKVTGLARDGDLVYIASDYAAGGDMTVMRGRPASEFVAHLIDIAEALQYAHEKGVVHGDLKPSNLLIGSNDDVLLSDFSTLFGSPYNTSPQRLRGETPVPADDVYGFGAVLYELLSGYPPFYPQPTRERVLDEPVPPLVPRYPAPAALIELAMQCLAKDAAARPSISTIVETLREAQREIRSRQLQTSAPGAAPQITSPTDESIRPQWRRSEPAAVAPSEATGFKRAAVFTALGVLIVAAVVVFALLPRWVDERNKAAPAPVAVAPPVASEPKPKAQEPVDFAQLAAQKQAAEEIRSALTNRWNQLTAQAVERWAAEPAQKVKDAIASGDEALGTREYAKAKSAFEAAEREIGALERDYPQVLAATLKQGSDAIERGDSAAARDAFELALAMSADNATAKAGLKRAQTLDQVLALLSTARAQEQAAQYAQALATYRQALQLDPQTQAATEAVARLQAQRAADAFGRAMARGYELLHAGQYAAARSAFEEARKLRPQAPDLSQALNDVQQAERTRAIEQHLERSKELQAKEQWVEALAELRAAAKLDPTVAAVNDSIAKVEPRARLHEEFQLYITQPERLFAPAVRQTARASLERARSLPQQGPVLRAQIEKVEEWLQRAETPVRISLQSDNLTRVTIYRVGELGTFTERTVELAPGKYVIVGTRPGYRDVRREVALFPGQPPEPLVIRCEDPV